MWVKVPQIDASSNTDYVWMYYGNASAPDGQDIAGTWDASFKGVWHLKEASGQHQDSTSNANNSSSLIVTQQGTAAGKIDGTDQFDGTDDRIQIPDSASLDQVTTQVTLEGWFKTNGSDTDGFVANKKDPPVANGYQIALEGGNPVGRVNGMPIPCSPVLSGNDNQWHYAALTYSSGGSAALWIDGASCNSSSGGSGSVANNQLFVIGEEGDYNDANPGGWFLNGTIDEVRVSNTVRSSAWIAAQYKSMKDDGLAPFVTFSAEELPPSGGPYTVVLTVMDNGGTFSTPASKVVDLTASPNCIFTHTDTVATKCTEIALQWTPAQAASSYTIFRSDSAGPWTQRFSNVSSVFYYDTTVSPLSSYQYYVQAVIPAGTLNASTNAPACTGGWSGNPPPHTFCPHPVPALSTPECAPILDPLPPTSPCGAITLTWLPAVGATSYSVFRNTVSDFATATKLASGLTVTTYLDTTVVPEVVYYYYVTNQNGVNPSNEEYSKSSCFRGTRWQER